ncbi:MAG: hypothetical protein COB50_04780 [Thiotrichales bacterium]|nr:MAG: hypothetical protein COB50_04780 [Thiotrichales bacterium]
MLSFKEMLQKVASYDEKIVNGTISKDDIKNCKSLTTLFEAVLATHDRYQTTVLQSNSNCLPSDTEKGLN